MRFFARSAPVLASLVLSAAALAQSFPSKPVTIMVPYPAGGLSDVMARKVNTALGTALGQPVIIENLGGASGSIAAQKVLNAPSDGYYLFQGSPNELILAPLAMSGVKYKSEDFRQVQRYALAPMAIMARGDLPAANADELAAYATKQAAAGKPMSYASVGQGSFYHLLGEQMSKTIGAPMLHVPYKGFADGVRDMMGGAIDIFISPYGSPQIEMAKQGKIKFVAVLGSTRDSMLPNIPSVSESKALKNFNFSIGTGYFVKKDTPEPVVQALHKALAHLLADPEMQTTFQALGSGTAPVQSLDGAEKIYTAEIAQFRAIAKSVNLQPQ